MSEGEDPPEEELDRLLARGHMGGPGRDRIVAKLLDARERRASWSRRRGAVAFGLMAAAALVLLMVRPKEKFAAKGGAADGASLGASVTCLEGSGTQTCPVGGTLVIRLHDVASAGRLAAFAERAGTSSRIWYFPAADGASPEVLAGVAPQTLAKGIRVGPEHAPGHYTLHVLLLAHPLTRAAITAALEETRDVAPSEVLARTTTPLEIVAP
jgi:hypothetical protein